MESNGSANNRGPIKQVRVRSHPSK